MSLSFSAFRTFNNLSNVPRNVDLVPCRCGLWNRETVPYDVFVVVNLLQKHDFSKCSLVVQKFDSWIVITKDAAISRGT